MAIVTSKGKTRIRTNDGRIHVNVNDNSVRILDDSDNLSQRIKSGTTKVFDSGRNNVQLGALPDATGGLAVAKDGKEVEDIF